MSATLLKIEGMTCSHCVLHTQKALEAVPGVTGVHVSLEKGEALVTHEDSLDEMALLKAVTAAGYGARRV